MFFFFLIIRGDDFCCVPLKRSTPPCLAQHLCSVLLGRLRCAPAKVPLTAPLQPVTKIPNPACRDAAVRWLSGHMLTQRATEMQGWKGKAWARCFLTLGVRISKASEQIFFFELWGERGKAMAADGDINSYCSSVQSRNWTYKPLSLISPLHRVPSGAGCYWGYGDLWRYDLTCWENRRGPGLLGANWEARQLWGPCNLDDLMESSGRGYYRHTNELWPFQSLYQVHWWTSLGGRTGAMKIKKREMAKVKQRWGLGGFLLYYI